MIPLYFKIKWCMAIKRRADAWLQKTISGWRCPGCNLWTWEDRLAKSRFADFGNDMIMHCSNCHYTSLWMFGPTMITLE